MRTTRRATYKGSSPPSSIRASQYNAALASDPRTLLCKALSESLQSLGSQQLVKQDAHDIVS